MKLLGFENVKEQKTSSNKILPLIFAFFLIINVISSGGHFDWSDGVLTFLVTESMALKYSAKVHPDIPSISSFYAPTVSEARSYMPYYTHRPIMLAAVAVPFYYAAIIGSLDPISLIAILVNSLVITLITLIIFCFSSELFKSRTVALILSLIFIGCSFILPYNTTFFPQPLQGLCILSAAYFLFKSKRHNNLTTFISEDVRGGLFVRKQTCLAGLAGLFLGLSVFAHPTSVIFIPGFVVYAIFFSEYWKKLVVVTFLIVLCTVMFSVGLVNFVKFGSFTEFGYGWMGSWSTHVGLEGLIGLWASPGAGLIFFFPLVIVLPIALKKFYKLNKGLFFLTIYVLMITWVYFGTLWYAGPYWQTVTWSGGLAWGPRYLVPILPFLVLPCGILIRNLTHERQTLMRTSIVALCIAGLLTNLPGNLVWIYNNWDYAIMHQGLRSDDEMYHTLTWDPHYSPIFLSAKMLFENYLINLKPEEYRNNTAYFYITYGLAPCPYDTYIYCKYGLIPILVLAIAALFMAVIILNDNHRISLSTLNINGQKLTPKRSAPK